MFKYKDIFNIKLAEKVYTGKVRTGNTLEGQFDFPVIKKTNVIPDNIISFNYAKSCKEPEKYFVHFYIDDYQFERVWKRPEYYAKVLGRFKGIIAPDFSTYTNMPKAQQIYQVYKSRLIAAYFASLGYEVIPNISWSDENSLNWSLEGIPKHSTVALSTNGVLNKEAKQNFINCYKKAMSILEPEAIIVVGEVPEEIQSDKTVQFDSRIKHLRCLPK